MPTRKVLDHGIVTLLDRMGDDAAISEAARVLPSAPWRPVDDRKLLRYMHENLHTSPFEHVVFKFFVRAPIFVFRQWHRHRTWSFNEISARYKELPELWYVPDAAAIGTQSKTNHQSRVMGDKRPEDGTLSNYIDESCKRAYKDYQFLLESGVPRELARGVLPANMYSEMIATVDLHNLLNFFSLRCDEHAQYEIRVYADAMRELITPVIPVTSEIVNSC